MQMSGDTSRLLNLPRRIAAWFRAGLQRFIPFDSRAHSWARRVNSYEELPGPYRPFVDGLPAPQRQPFPYSVLTPTLAGIGREHEIEKLVCLVGEALHVVEQRGGSLAVTSFPLNGRCWVERGVLLLYSWISIHDPAGQGAARPVTLRFNSVGDHLMLPFVDALRAKTAGLPYTHTETERARFSHLAQTHFKFMSYGRESIRPGARVINILLQPQIRQPFLRLGGRSIERLVSPAHVVILTDSELILIRDDDSQRWISGTPYGAIWTYVPRAMIASASIAATGGAMEQLSIGLTGGTRIESLFDPAQKAELEQLLYALTC